MLKNNLGYPRVGTHRELKKACEQYWAGKTGRKELFSVARNLREEHWKLQQYAGIDLIPCNDFSFYDHVLDTAAMVGAVPSRVGWKGKSVDLPTYFAKVHQLLRPLHPLAWTCGPVVPFVYSKPHFARHENG